MIQVIDNSGQILNTFPTLTAVAYACEGLTPYELYRLTFLNLSTLRYISHAEVAAEMNRRGISVGVEKRGFCSGRVVGGKVVITESV